MIRYSIYIVDDDSAIRDGLTTALEGSYVVRAFSSGEDAIEELARNSPDLMLLDIGLPGKNGMDVLREARDLCPETLVVMVTAHEEVSTAVSAMRPSGQRSSRGHEFWNSQVHWGNRDMDVYL